jgi:hypothetical protein
MFLWLCRASCTCGWTCSRNLWDHQVLPSTSCHARPRSKCSETCKIRTPCGTSQKCPYFRVVLIAGCNSLWNFKKQTKDFGAIGFSVDAGRHVFHSNTLKWTVFEQNVFYYIDYYIEWHSGSTSVSNARDLGFEPRQGQGFSSPYEMPELLGAGDSQVLWMRR